MTLTQACVLLMQPPLEGIPRIEATPNAEYRGRKMSGTGQSAKSRMPRRRRLPRGDLFPRPRDFLGVRQVTQRAHHAREMLAVLHLEDEVHGGEYRAVLLHRDRVDVRP